MNSTESTPAMPLLPAHRLVEATVDNVYQPKYFDVITGVWLYRRKIIMSKGSTYFNRSHAEREVILVLLERCFQGNFSPSASECFRAMLEFS